jgi:hypothetical protein
MYLIGAERENLKSLGVVINEERIRKQLKLKWPWYKRWFRLPFNRKLKKAETIFELIQEDKIK